MVKEIQTARSYKDATYIAMRFLADNINHDKISEVRIKISEGNKYNVVKEFEVEAIKVFKAEEKV